MSAGLEMEFFAAPRQRRYYRKKTILFGILRVSGTEQVGSALLNYLLPSDELGRVYSGTLWPQTLLNGINFCFQS